MKISPITNNFNKNKTTNSQINNVSYISQPQKSDTVSFSGAKTGLLSKIISIFKSPKIEEIKPFNKDFFLAKIKEFKKKDGFQIYTQEGKLVHNQKPKDYQITEATSQKAKNNVVLLSSDSQLSLSNLCDFWEHRATHIVSANRKDKKYQILELSKPNALSVERAKDMYWKIGREINDAMHLLCLQQALKTGKPAMMNGSQIAPYVEAKHFNNFIKELGFKKTEIPFSNVK